MAAPEPSYFVLACCPSPHEASTQIATDPFSYNATTSAGFRRAYPGVELTLEEANTTRLTAGLDDGTLDIAFLRPEGASGRDLQLRLISEKPMLLAMPAGHAMVGEDEVDLAKLAKDPFILFPRSIGPTLHDTVMDACRKSGFEPHVDQFAPQLSFVSRAWSIS